MPKKPVWEHRDEVIRHMLSILRDALALGDTSERVNAGFNTVRESKKFKRLPQYAREYVRGYVDSYQTHVMVQHTEHGSWVTMPDGAVKWFGVSELRMPCSKLNELYPELVEYGFHRYIHEHQIPERSGIYWRANSKYNRGPGEKPYFIPKP
jgi:hypothetical protein